MSKQNIHNIVFPVLVVLVLLGAIGYGVYQYQTNRKPAPSQSVSQLTKERNDAVRAMQLHDAVNKTNLNTATQQTNDAQAKLTTACTALKTAKLSSPVCL